MTTDKSLVKDLFSNEAVKMSMSSLNEVPEVDRTEQKPI